MEDQASITNYPSLERRNHEHRTQGHRHRRRNRGCANHIPRHTIPVNDQASRRRCILADRPAIVRTHHVNRRQVPWWRRDATPLRSIPMNYRRLPACSIVPDCPTIVGTQEMHGPKTANIRRRCHNTPRQPVPANDYRAFAPPRSPSSCINANCPAVTGAQHMHRL